MVSAIGKLSPEVEAARNAYLTLIKQYLGQIESTNGHTRKLQQALLDSTESTPRAVRIEGLHAIINAHVEHFGLIELDPEEDALEYWENMRYGANSTRYGLVTKMLNAHKKLEAEELKALGLPPDLHHRGLHTKTPREVMAVQEVEGLESEEYTDVYALETRERI